MKTLISLLALMLCFTTVRADVASDLAAALSTTVSLSVPVELVSKPDSAFWKQPALKGQHIKWKIKVPASVFLGWLARTDGQSDAEKKAILKMVKTANTESFIGPIRVIANAAAGKNADGKTLLAAVNALDAALERMKSATSLSRDDQSAVTSFFAACAKPSFKG